MKNIYKYILVSVLIYILTACGEEDKSPPIADKSFTVNLSNIDIRKRSNGNSILVDTSSITSRTLILSPK